MIIWINGAFGAGKTTLAGELMRRVPGAVLFDPEYVGYLLREWVPVPTGDFQDLPSWRELVIETALALRRHHADRVLDSDSPERDEQARAFCLRNLDNGIAAAARQPAGTLMLRSDKLSPPELADEILSQLRNLR